LGGPRRRLGLSKVQGISKAAQARHGIPDSSHCLQIPSASVAYKVRVWAMG
jgi:hypothetical protein